MEILLTIVKYLALIQLCLVILFLIILYLTKYYQQRRDKKHAILKREIKETMNSHFDKNAPFTEQNISLLKKSIPDVLLELEEIERNKGQLDYFKIFKKELSNSVLRPIAERWTHSRVWYKRFEATVCYSYGYESKDKKYILKLLHEPSALIAINAANLIFKSNNKEFINEIITIFSKGRRLQQSLFLENVPKQNINISPIVIERLEHDQDLYVRIFCYRLLTAIPQKSMVSCVKKDLESDLKELKIAIVNYLAHCEDSKKNEEIYALAFEPDWEIISAVAKALGKIHTVTGLDILTKLLHSSNWWVRHNAGISLNQQGEKGIKILKSQTPEKDKFAFETAQAVLMERNSI